MILTNAAGLPEAFVEAVRRDPYDKGKADYSATGLLKPARMGALEKLYKGSLKVDASSRVWALWGSAVHKILEESADPTKVDVEARLFMERQGCTISGCIDWMEEVGPGIYDVCDYKTTSTFGVMYGHDKGHGPKPEWVQQAQIYMTLMRDNDMIPRSYRVVAILRDWVASKVGRERNYPESQVVVLEIEEWDEETREAFIWDRVFAHRKAEHRLPLCTDRERWLRNKRWAVMKGAAKKALRLFKSEEEASAYVAEAMEKHPEWALSIVERQGQAIRCESYCPVAKHCLQWQKEQANGINS